MKLLNEKDLLQFDKPKLLEYIIKQIEFIDKNRGYSSGVSKFKLINYPKEVLIKIALTNNEYVKEFSNV